MGRTMNNIEGLAEVQQMFRNLADMAPQIYEEELTKTIDAVESSAKQNVHSISGNLVGSIEKKITKGRSELKGTVKAGGVKAPHAHLVEFGHRLMNENGEVIGDVPAHPFLRKAYEQHVGDLLRSLSRAIDRLISSS